MLPHDRASHRHGEAARRLPPGEADSLRARQAPVQDADQPASDAAQRVVEAGLAGAPPARRWLAPALRLIIGCAQSAEDLNEPGLATLSSYLDCVISHAGQLALPGHGGPVPADAETLAARSSVHQAIQRILDRGRRDGTIRGDAMTRDLIALTALLAQPLPHSPGPDQTARRLKAFFLDGLAPPAR